MGKRSRGWYCIHCDTKNKWKDIQCKECGRPNPAKIFLNEGEVLKEEVGE